MTREERDAMLQRLRQVTANIKDRERIRRMDDRREAAKRALTIGIAAALLVLLVAYIATGGPGPRQPYQGGGDECIEYSRWEFC